MFFLDYKDTNVVYHVAPITDLNKILKSGIKYNDKKTYESKYLNFHKYLDSYKLDMIPDWVVREKAIFTSLNFSENHCWHSHSVIMAIEIDTSKCWVANENLANKIYEPFILQEVEEFEVSKKYLINEGMKNLKRYWETSLSFNENLVTRNDLKSGYDAEVLVFHEILPANIKPLYIVSDHSILSINKWKKYFKGDIGCGNRKDTK